MLLRNVYNEIIVSGILRPGWSPRRIFLVLSVLFDREREGPAGGQPAARLLRTDIVRHANDGTRASTQCVTLR